MRWKRVLKVVYPLFIFFSMIVLILHLRKLDYSFAGRSFYDLWPVIYIPLMIIAFVLLFIRLMRDERKISREHKNDKKLR